MPPLEHLLFVLNSLLYDSWCTLLSTAQSQAQRRGDQLPQDPGEKSLDDDAQKYQENGQSGAPKHRGVEMDVETLVVSKLTKDRQTMLRVQSNGRCYCLRGFFVAFVQHPLSGVLRGGMCEFDKVARNRRALSRLPRLPPEAGNVQVRSRCLQNGRRRRVVSVSGVIQRGLVDRCASKIKISFASACFLAYRPDWKNEFAAAYRCDVRL